MNRAQRHFPDFPKLRARDAGDLGNASLVISRLVSKGKHLVTECYYVVMSRRATIFFQISAAAWRGRASMEPCKKRGRRKYGIKDAGAGPRRQGSWCDRCPSASPGLRCSQRGSLPCARASSSARCECAAAVGRSTHVRAHHLPAHPPSRREWRSPDF